MEKPNQDPPPHHLPLKCPRCDSSNTKFCYYNNYSLSQPRHFCKACKRYWTRGGTLRNVPVGGGCRKNKRPKRHSAADGASSSSAAAAPNPTALDLSPATTRMQNHNHNPLFYSPLELNFPFSGFNSARVSSEFDLQSQMNGLGLGFSSGPNDYKNAYKPIQDMISTNSASSSPPFPAAGNSNSIFFGSSGFANSSSAMASLLASSVHDGNKSVMQYHDPQMPGGNAASMGKDVKQERENGSVWNPNPNPNPNQNQIHEQINSSDPSSFLWNTTNLSAWFDPSSMGSSSVPSLI